MPKKTRLPAHLPTLRRPYQMESVTMRYDDDPRLTEEYVREASTADGTQLTIVGVVHDHPASTFRVQRRIDSLDPDALALELPPLAIPLFTEYAQDERNPPQFGGEMSAAIQAVDTDRIVGIDGPSAGFASYLLRQLSRQEHSMSTVRALFSSLSSVSKHAVVCRFGATVSRLTGLTVEVDAPVQHECTWSDEPDVQARDERAQVRQARTVMNAFQSSSVSNIQKTARESYMADRIEAIASEKVGSILAVVGIAHLDPVAEGVSDI